jgi:hypothetical protein
MSLFKIIALTTAVIFVFGIAMIDCAVAGEKMKWHGTAFTTESKHIEVGDEEGHVLLIFKAKQLYVNENTGEKIVSDVANMMDINPKKKQFSLWAVANFPFCM